MIDWKALSSTSGTRQPTGRVDSNIYPSLGQANDTRVGTPSGVATTRGDISPLPTPVRPVWNDNPPPTGTEGESRYNLPAQTTQTSTYTPNQAHYIDPNKWNAWQGGQYQQGWYRDPSWPGHVVWNQDYGYQDWGNVVDQNQLSYNPNILQEWYDRAAQSAQSQAATGGGGGAGYTGDYSQYQQQYQDMLNNWYAQMQNMYQNQGATQGTTPTGTTPTGMEGLGYTGGSRNFDETTGQYTTPGTTGGYGLYGGNYSDFPMPYEWDDAQNVMTQFAYGNPVDYQKWWSAQQPALERTISDQAKKATEQAGLAGLRWSTPLQRNITDIAGRETANTFADYMTMALGGEEQSRNRALQAAGMLPGLGQMRFQAPMDWASQMYGMGTQQQGISQSALDRIYQDFLRTSPEMNPYLAQALGFLGLQSQTIPQQYQPSFLGQLLGGASSMLPFLFF